MESHIDDALAAMTIVFDVDRYSLVMSAYQMLDKLKVKGYIKFLMGVYLECRNETSKFFSRYNYKFCTFNGFGNFKA